MRAAWTVGLAVGALAASVGTAGAVADVTATDKKAIVKVINLVERPGYDTSKPCASGLTTTYLKARFKSQFNCENKLAPGYLTQPKSVTVSAISVSGKSAKATVKENGGDKAGATGTWRLTKTAKGWRVSKIDANFLKSSYKILYGSKYRSCGADCDPLHGKAYRACGVDRLVGRSDTAFLVFQYQADASRNVEIGKAFAACTVKAPGGKSPFFRTFVEERFKRDIAEGYGSQALADCIVPKLRDSYTEPAFVNMYYDGLGSPAVSKYLQREETFGEQCSKGGSTQGFRAPKKVGPPRGR